jgi:hypothetical protein
MCNWRCTVCKREFTYPGFVTVGWHYKPGFGGGGVANVCTAVVARLKSYT